MLLADVLDDGFNAVACPQVQLQRDSRRRGEEAMSVVCYRSVYDDSKCVLAGSYGRSERSVQVIKNKATILKSMIRQDAFLPPLHHSTRVFTVAYTSAYEVSLSYMRSCSRRSLAMRLRFQAR